MNGRPHYETESNLKSERKLAKNVAIILGLKHQKLSEVLYGIDNCFYCDGPSDIQGIRGIPKVWSEIKCRTYSSDRFSHYMISLAKFYKLLDLEKRAESSKSKIIVWFTDAVLYVDVADCYYIIGMGGRKDRKDELDVEPCAFISIDQFKRFINAGDPAQQQEV